MINLDQVRTLEWKVKQAVQLIVHLRRENDTLRGRLSDTEVRLQELEALLESFKASQTELESGIRSALEELDNLEASPAPVSVAEAPQAVSYPPEPEPEAVTEPTPEVSSSPTFAEDEPSALFERSPAFASEDPAQTQPSEADLAFEEEFAALAAQEEAAAASTVPESVELEAEPEVAEVEAPRVEEKKLEQPGLGIF